MFKRLFWASVGAGAGLYAARRLKRTARRYTPAGLQERVSGFGDTARDFLDDVRVAAAERELELQAALGLAAPVRDGRLPGDRAEWNGPVPRR